jgi:ribosomal protein S18 acetylase RimI-like enzyme
MTRKSPKNTETDLLANIVKMTYREEIQPLDRTYIYEIVTSTDIFSKEEVDIAIELVDERLSKGSRSGYLFLFAESEGHVIGYTCYGPIAGTNFSFDLYWIAVHRHFQGNGIGKALLTKSEILIKKDGGRRIYVETSSRDPYKNTRAFYQAFGYRQAAFLEDFYAHGDGKIIYVKSIT